jgi:hypothetical protein
MRFEPVFSIMQIICAACYDNMLDWTNRSDYDYEIA